MARRRPWRAVAFVPDATAPTGRKRELAGRTAACTREGLQPFLDRHVALGHVCDVLEVQPLQLQLEGVDHGHVS